MFLDVVDLRDFYSSDLGRVIRPILSDHFRKIWPGVSGDRLLEVERRSELEGLAHDIRVPEGGDEDDLGFDSLRSGVAKDLEPLPAVRPVEADVGYDGVERRKEPRS